MLIEVVGHDSVLSASDVQLDDSVVSRCIGDREGASKTVWPHDTHVLARDVIERLNCRNADSDDGDFCGWTIDRNHPCGYPTRQFRSMAKLDGVDHDIAEGTATTQ
jgi:hypothetical protein